MSDPWPGLVPSATSPAAIVNAGIWIATETSCSVPMLPQSLMTTLTTMSDYRFVGLSDQVTWTCERYPQGCWRCRLRVLTRWPRPYRHFNCGPERGFPGVPLLAVGGEEDR